MTPIESLLQTILTLDLWQIVKVFVLLGIAVYIAFSLLVLKEVYLMARTLKNWLNYIIILISWLHLFFSILVFLLALFVL